MDKRQINVPLVLSLSNINKKVKKWINIVSNVYIIVLKIP